MLSISKDTASRLKLWAQSPGVRIYALYVLVFAVFFFGIRAGLGQYWDWSFPYFSDHLSNFFTSKATSWTSANMGSPLGYSSDYFLRFVISLFAFLPPELVRYGSLVIIFAAGALGMNLLARRHTGPGMAFLLGLVTFVNPTIFYKYTAGHFNYLVAFVLFIYFVYFLLHHFKKDIRSAVTVGLFLAFMGVQIQFFVIGTLFLAVFLLFNRAQLRWRYLAIMLALPVLVNLVWLSNFLVGAANAVETGAAAARVTFKNLSGSDFLSIFTFSFAKATLLTKFYAFYELLWNTTLFVFMLWLLVRAKKKETFEIVLLVFLTLMIFLATGLWQIIPAGPLTSFYPMLREVGHFAPVIVLIALVLIARLLKQTKWRWVLVSVLVGSMFIVGVKFQYYSQGYSFADVRAKFAPFKELADADTSTYRVLAYPFFDQYAFKHLPQDPPGTLPLKNTGHDSFAAFASQEFINNTIPPHKFQDSVQYRLLQTYDVDVLRPYDVKYIFDFSEIYESNYERYVPPTVYNNDRSLIKNDSEFFAKLLANNPGKLRKINNHVLEVTDYQPRVATAAQLVGVAEDENTSDLEQFSQQALGRPLDYTENTRELVPYLSHITRLDGNGKPLSKTGGFTQTIPASTSKQTLYISHNRSTLFYRATANELIIFTQTSGRLSLDGKSVGNPGEQPITLQRIPLAGSARFLLFKGDVTAVKPNSEGRLGVASQGDTVELFTASQNNLVKNPSFETELWQGQVNDCNNYDFDESPSLDMGRVTDTASSGRAALELSARKHDACTFTEVMLKPNTSYMLNFDFQSPNAKVASFYVAFENDEASLARGTRAITDDKWDTHSAIFTTPNKGGKARLYLYALEQDGKTVTRNRYDNVSLVPLGATQKVSIPKPAQQYTAIDLPAGGEHAFVFTASNYRYRNLIADPSFEQGTWQQEVSDCRNYDNQPQLQLRASNKAVDGTRALELGARRHDACVRTTSNVKEDTEYQLSFNYHGSKGKSYGYAVSFDDPENTIRRQQFTIEQSGWGQALFSVRSPKHATTMTLYLYSFETDGKSMNTIIYDNVELIEQPDFVGRYYAAQAPQKIISTPKKTDFKRLSNTSYAIHVSGAREPFFLTLSESYHPKWQLSLGGRAVAAEHFRANGYQNAWLIVPQELCKQNTAACTKQHDGSYAMTFASNFTPQGWFTAATAVSWLTIAGSGAYLLFVRPEDRPEYRSWRRKLYRRKRS